MSKSCAALHVDGYRAPEPDAVAAKRARKTLAQRLRRAAAKAAVQWRGDSEMTAAAE